jgi:hypothetical protein
MRMKVNDATEAADAPIAISEVATGYLNVDSNGLDMNENQFSL